MKKHIPIFTFLATSILTVSALLGVALNQKEAVKAEAYNRATLTKNFDLNDTPESTIRSYYSPVSGKTGDQALIALKNILKNGQKYYSYDKGKADIWNMYEITDRDWVKSPKEEIPGYDPVTNTISNYQYRANGTGPYVHALYYNRDKDNIVKAFGDHDQYTLLGLNQEHIWPKSHGFDIDGDGGARGDVMHLWPGNGTVNALHLNHHYGYVDKSQTYVDIQEKYKKTYDVMTVYGNYTGSSKTYSDYSGVVFEPQDSDKGDIARACFYLVARYNYLSGSDIDKIDSNNPNLAFATSVSQLNQANGTSSESQPYYLGILEDLLEWNRLDKPDEFEIHRNNLLYENFTNNRNPFIDFPEWADYIWGDKKGQVLKPSSDPINKIDNHPGGNTGGETKPDEGGEEIPIPQEFKKVTIYGSSQVKTKASEISEGEYFITAPKADNSETYISLADIKDNGGTPEGINAYDPSIKTGYFKVKAGSSPNQFSLSNEAGDLYLDGSHSTSNKTKLTKTADPAYWTFTNDPSQVKSYGVEDSDVVLVSNVSNTDITDRGLIFNGTKFAYYAISNAKSSNYTGVYFHKVIYTYDVLIDKLAKMTCQDMANASFNSDLVKLHDSLTPNEIKELSNKDIKCSDGNTYKADYAYAYAINYFGGTSQAHDLDFFISDESKIFIIAFVTFTASLMIAFTIIEIKKYKKHRS